MKFNGKYIFDFDGTIAVNGKITPTNLIELKKIKNKILNTSRSYESIPSEAKEIFDSIMCLNGSKWYVNGELSKSFETIDKSEIINIIRFAKENNFNISFNSTNDYWQNVWDEDSKNFMDEAGMDHREEIVPPSEVFLISLSHGVESKAPLTYLNCFQQTKRLVEISPNNKGNISKLITNFIAIGDGANDYPMFEGAKKSFLIKNGEINFEKLLKG